MISEVVALLSHFFNGLFRKENSESPRSKTIFISHSKDEFTYENQLRSEIKSRSNFLETLRKLRSEFEQDFQEEGIDFNNFHDFIHISNGESLQDKLDVYREYKWIVSLENTYNRLVKSSYRLLRRILRSKYLFASTVKKRKTIIHRIRSNKSDTSDDDVVFKIGNQIGNSIFELKNFFTHVHNKSATHKRHNRIVQLI